MIEISAWLDGAAMRVFAFCATLFVLLNTAAVALIFVKRDRGLVNRWTARWLAANIMLIGSGVGVPLVAKVVRMTVDAFSASKSLTPPSASEESEGAPRDVRTPRR